MGVPVKMHVSSQLNKPKQLLMFKLKYNSKCLLHALVTRIDVRIYQKVTDTIKCER